MGLVSMVLLELVNSTLFLLCVEDEEEGSDGNRVESCDEETVCIYKIR